MPRKARLDVPGALHHIMVRGIIKSAIFDDDQDRQKFLERLGGNIVEAKCSAYAWVLVTNHVHILFKSGGKGSSTVMRKLLTWYAIYYNRRHKRTVHLGSGDFVTAIFKEAEDKQIRQFKIKRTGLTITGIIEKECKTAARISEKELKNGSKRMIVRTVREKIARRGVEELGLTSAEIARNLGVCTSTVTRALVRGENAA